jgi:glucose-1-phosphate cytidylyltransferase
MKTVILCGGIGYRLKEETEFKPKPMVNIGGKPILWHIMKIYSYYGFNDFIIALGYKGDYIRQYFASNANLVKNFKITLVDTGEETLPGERILRLKNYIPNTDENFMVTYGDGVSDINIKELVKFHIKQGTIGTVSGVHPRSKYGLLATDKNKIVTSFTEKPVLKERTNGGFMVFKRNFFKYLGLGEFEHEALKRLVKEKQLSVFSHDGFWHCMDTYPDVDNLNKLWRESPPWKIWKD